MQEKVLVTGGMGYIGSHTVVDLIENNYEVISVDNYSRSFAHISDRINDITNIEVKNYAIDLCDLCATETIFKEHKIDIVIHFAAFKSVPESVAEPLMYYHNNIHSLVNILQLCEKYQVKSFIFSSSCSVYGNTKDLPVTENTILEKPECPYAATKQMGEQILKDFAKKNERIQIVSLRYFNPVGAHTSAKIGELPIGKPNNLVPVITQTAAGIIKEMYVWGNDYPTRDGSCIRDYIHVLDIADAHTLALKYAMQKVDTNNFEIFNLGTGKGVSVLEAIQSFEKVSNKKLNYKIGKRRDGDVAAIYANNEKAFNVLGWNPKYSLDDMMRTAWLWQCELNKEKEINPK